MQSELSITHAYRPVDEGYEAHDAHDAPLYGLVLIDTSATPGRRPLLLPPPELREGREARAH